MGKVGAFLQVDRKGHGARSEEESIGDWEEFVVPLSLESQCEQASRCMNCGVAFCQTGAPVSGTESANGQNGSAKKSGRAVGCPLHNLIPETNDLLYHKRFEDAIARVSLTNPFPEFTGRVCPAPCEAACNLGLNQAPVTINDNERALSDLAWQRGISPLPPAPDNAPVASIIGSGPAGLGIGWELARRGWKVRIYEKSNRPGGLLMNGIPNMKLPKWVVDRRVNLMKESGIEFFCGIDASTHAQKISKDSDVVVIATGAGVARDVSLEGRDLEGIYFALDYLKETTCALLEEREATITAQDKDVVIIGGGDTGCDCVACALRQGARSITQVIRAKRAADTCATHDYWPEERPVYSQGYGQREVQFAHGKDPRIFSTDTIAFSGAGSVEAVRIQDLSYEGGRHLVEGTEAEITAQLVLIAKGFIGAEAEVFEAFGVDPAKPADGANQHCLRAAGKDSPAIYVAGDAHLGSTLVVTALADALECAREIDRAQKQQPTN